MAATVGRGFTVTVTVVVDIQLPAVAVMVKVVVCWVEVLLISVPVILPVPLAPMPVRSVVLSLVQLKTVPGTLLGLVITMFVIADPEHPDCVAGVAFTVGVGFTVTVTLLLDVHEPAVAITVKVVVMAAAVLLTKVPVIVDPVPLVAIPVSPAGVVLVQLKTVPGTPFGLEMSIGVIARPEHTD